jgi:hypothetical protein
LSQPEEHVRPGDRANGPVDEGRDKVKPDVRLNPALGLQRPADDTGLSPAIDVISERQVTLALDEAALRAGAGPDRQVEGLCIDLAVKQPVSGLAGGIGRQSGEHLPTW